jgi:hypothetical protein
MIRVIFTALFAMTFAAQAGALDLHTAKEIECGSVPDGVKGGKWLLASCSQFAEKVFYTNDQHPPTDEHCKTDKKWYYEKWVINVSPKRKMISWTETKMVAEYAKEIMIKSYMKKEKLSRKEATKTVNEKTMITKAYKIENVGKMFDLNYVNPVTREIYEKPRYEPSLILQFGDKYDNYTMYIPSESKDFIMSSYSTIFGTSYVTMRFGKCKISM